MHAPSILIFGSGGHAKVAHSIAVAQGREVYGFYDPSCGGGELLGLKIYAMPPSDRSLAAFVAIGDNKIRERAAAEWLGDFATLIHPAAVVDPTAEVGLGSMVAAGSIVQASAKIGRHCIVNTRASVDHDCTVADFCHIAPGATLCGGVTLGRRVLVGAGATIIPSKKVDDFGTIAAGAVVIEDVSGEAPWGGVPARPLW